MRKSIILILTVALVMGMMSSVIAQDIYKVGIGEDPTTKNYWSIMGPGDASMYNFVVSSGYYSPLFGISFPSYAVTPGLAADDPTEFAQEGDYYTSVVSLKENMEWNDGTRFTADDVVFTYNTLLDLEPKGNWSQYHPDILEKVEKVDDYSVKFYFNDKPGLAQWTYGILQCSIMPKSQWGSVVEVAKTREDPTQYLYSYSVDELVTINGMEFDQWEKGAYWTNTSTHQNPESVTRIYESGRHEIESGDWSWAGLGEKADELSVTVEEGPFIDKANYRLYSNQEAMIMALKKGDIDYMLSAQGLTKGFRKELEGDEEVEVISNPSNGFRMLAFNRSKEVFDIYEFQQAVATLIDRDYLLNSVLQGAAKPLATFVPPGNEFWHNPDVSAWGAGLSRAERVNQAMNLLEKAGFTWEQKPEVDLEKGTYTPGSGIIKPDGEKMESFDILTPPGGYDPLRATAGLYIQMWLTDLGIPVRTKTTQFNVILDQVFTKGEFDAFILGWGLGGAFPSFLYDFFHTDGGFNDIKFSDEEYDQLAEEFMAATDIEKARDLAYQLQEKLQDSLPYIVLFSSPIYDAYRKNEVKFPSTEVLDGIQGFYGLPTSVKLAE